MREGLCPFFQAVGNTFVNLVDLVDEIEFRLFDTEQELSQYSLTERKIFPRSDCAGSLLEYLLRQILNPREPGEDVYRGRWRRGRGRGRGGQGRGASPPAIYDVTAGIGSIIL